MDIYWLFQSWAASALLQAQSMKYEVTGVFKEVCVYFDTLRWWSSTTGQIQIVVMTNIKIKIMVEYSPRDIGD